MNYKTLTLLFTVLIGLCPALYLGNTEVRAQEDTGVYDLGEVVVSGKIEGVQATQSVYTVTSEDIETKNATTLDQAINLLPGVNVRVGGEGSPRIDIRGFKTRHVILLLDGVPINSAFDAQFDPSIIPTENIAKIKLTTGASSVLYGQGGLGGVINIITKKGVQGLHGMVGAETGDHEPYLLKGSISGGKNGADFFLSGSSTKINSFPLSSSFDATSEQERGYRENSDRKRNNLFGSASFNPLKDLRLGFTMSYSEGSAGKPPATLNEPYDPFASSPKYERIDHFNNLSAQLAGEYDITRAFSVRGWGYINQSHQHDNLYDNANYDSFNLKAGSFREQIDTRIMGVTLQPKYDLGRAGTLTASLGSERDTWQNEGLKNVGVDTYEPVDVDESFNIYSAAIEYEVSLLKNLGFVAGYGHYWQDKDEGDQKGHSLLGGLHYDLFPETRLKAAYKRNIRFPTMRDLYNPEQPTGNPDLATERSYTYEAGVEQKLPFNTMVGVTGFHTEARNFIQNDQATGMMQNLPKIIYYGVETSLSTRPIKGLQVRASYTYLHSKDEVKNDGPQQYTPAEKATLEAKYSFDWGLTLYGSYLYVGDQYCYTKNSYTPMMKMKMENYSIVDLKVSQQLFQDKLNLYIGARNLFDKNYETSYGYPQAGRFIYGGFEYRL